MRKIINFVFLFLVVVFGIDAKVANAHEKFLAIDIDKSIFAEVVGDGIEAGFVVYLDYFGTDQTRGAPEVSIPENDNNAACRLDEIRGGEIEELFPDSGYYKQNYAVRFRSKVMGDTGGCIVWIKNSISEQTSAIVSYQYVTNY